MTGRNGASSQPFVLVRRVAPSLMALGGDSPLVALAALAMTAQRAADPEPPDADASDEAQP